MGDPKYNEHRKEFIEGAKKNPNKKEKSITKRSGKGKGKKK